MEEILFLRQNLQHLLAAAIKATQADCVPVLDDIHIERTRHQTHGDFASNIAMILGEKIDVKPRQLAVAIVNNLPKSAIIARTEVAGPGFINFYLKQEIYFNVVGNILDVAAHYGRSNYGGGKSVLVEFVSANPTGPLHIGHGRGAAYGETIANLLQTIGYRVEKEYYINDTGRQVDILAVSIWLRYLEKCGLDVEFPVLAYQGDYVRNIAQKLFDDKQCTLKHKVDGSPENRNSEAYIDHLIKTAKAALGSNNYQLILNMGITEILSEIRSDLSDFGITFKHWFSERNLIKHNAIDACIAKLTEQGHTFIRNEALWFRSTCFGDEKDRVLRRENGQTTYFASDIAYHLTKLDRGYDKTVNIWGADHHGYIGRIKAALAALGENPTALEILLVQFATLYRGAEKLPMSTRTGQFVTLQALLNEVGKDAARFFYVMRKSEQHLEFDLELAKLRTNKNPVYYIQYAHARICNVFKQLKERGFEHDQPMGHKNLAMLTQPSEQKLMTELSKYPEIIHTAATEYAPHQVAYYLKELAHEFHSYYNACKIIIDSDPLRNARLNLIGAARQVIGNGLGILGVSAPKEM